MLIKPPEPEGKLDAMTGYSFSTPVWDGGTWVTPVVAEVRAAPKVNGPKDVPDWDAINWQVHEGNVRRLRQRIFKAAREQDWAKLRSFPSPVAAMAGTAALGLSRELRTRPARSRPRTSRRGQVEHRPVATSLASARPP